MNYNGGCCCGALRYVSKLPPLECGYCHCVICQKTSAAPALVFASFPINEFRYTRGTPAIYHSSEHGNREFCSLCGTQIAFREAEDAETVDANVGSLDDPLMVSPEYHIWCQSRVSWFKTADSLPEYQKGKLDDGGT
jgi:hypothetical protein